MAAGGAAEQDERAAVQSVTAPMALTVRASQIFWCFPSHGLERLHEVKSHQERAGAALAPPAG